MKTSALYIKLSPEDHAAIRRNAAACGKSVSEYIRQRAMCFCPKVEAQR